jgi:hypothetical protein
VIVGLLGDADEAPCPFPFAKRTTKLRNSMKQQIKELKHTDKHIIHFISKKLK